MPETLPPKYFEDVYAAKRDPWNFATSEYEAAKYRQTVETLTRECYDRGFEIGCSIGILSRLLAQRCAYLLSVDVSDVALQQARERCAPVTNIRLEQMSVPAQYPQDKFDLTVVSEVGYYLGQEDLQKLAEQIGLHTNPQGQLLLVHWTPVAPDYPLTGDQVHEFFLSLPQWQCVRQFREAKYRIELLQLEQ